MGTHLILHKVRGEPEFDIAEKVQIGEEEGWIISSSGHRAYPYGLWALEDLVDTSDIDIVGSNIRPIRAASKLLPDWEDWPDHYPAKVRKEAKPERTKALAFLASLGLGTKIVRRI